MDVFDHGPSLMQFVTIDDLYQLMSCISFSKVPMFFIKELSSHNDYMNVLRFEESLSHNMY
jgi:hypothetical protein